MEIDIDNSPSYVFGLKDLDEIVQNVKVIINTRKGSVPLDRDFGVDWAVVDKPNTMSLQKLKQEIIKAIRKYEPRVKVKSITVIPDEFISDGIMKVKMKCEINL